MKMGMLEISYGEREREREREAEKLFHLCGEVANCMKEL